MKTTHDKKLLVDIAHLYYEKNMTQRQIAQRLHVSRSLVSKLLVRARNQGVVEIVIRDDDLHIHKELEDRMKRIFGLKEVFCVEPMNGESLENAISRRSEKYLLQRFPKVKYVAVSGGRMVKSIAKDFTPTTHLEHLTFVPLCGGVDQELWEAQANTVCEFFANHCGATGLQLHAPIVVDSEDAKKMLMKQNFVAKVMEKAKHAEIALVGIGEAHRYAELAQMYMGEKILEEQSIMSSIKGDIIYHYYDKCGKVVDCDWNRRNMALSLENIKEIPEVIGVAYETEKAESIYIAVREKILNTLIITEPLATLILKLHSKYL